MISNDLKNILLAIEKTFPLPSRFRGVLPKDIAELSKLLTAKRGDRTLSYLNKPNFLSAYLRYYLPWNIVRLCNLLPRLDIKFNKGDIIVDLGSGPLTFAIALWVSRPDLRNIPLEIYCIDRSSAVLEAGKKLFENYCGKDGDKCNWKINLIKKSINFKNKVYIEGKDLLKKQKAKMVCAVNLFNEGYDKIAHSNTLALKHLADNIGYFLHDTASKEGVILTVEPGIPQSGRFISFLRDALIKNNRMPLSPCTHSQNCPFNNAGDKKRWCHFAFNTEAAPKELLRLSALAKLPKERITYSYLFAGNNLTTEHEQKKDTLVRVISDAFSLQGGFFGRYGCCEKGLILLQGEKSQIEEISSCDLVNAVCVSQEVDKKSGALIYVKE